MNEVLIGIGANLTADGYENVLDGLQAAINLLPDYNFKNIKCSSWYETTPVPESDQPLFINAVISAQTSLPAPDVLANLHKIENRFGRKRRVRNDPRVLDLDLLDYNRQEVSLPSLSLPHPRFHLRAFVLIPLQEMVPDFIHPQLQISLQELIDGLPKDQKIRKLQM